MILGQDIWTELELNQNLSEHAIEADARTFKEYTTLMVDLGTYILKNLNTGWITPKEFSTNAYVEEVYGSEHVRTATKQLRVILYDKYEKVDLHKVIETQCQHLTTTQRHELITLLQRLEYIFGGTLGTWKTYQVDFGLKGVREANILTNIPSTKDTWGKIQKGGWRFSLIRILQDSKWFRMGSPILCAT